MNRLRAVWCRVVGHRPEPWTTVSAKCHPDCLRCGAHLLPVAPSSPSPRLDSSSFQGPPVPWDLPKVSRASTAIRTRIELAGPDAPEAIRTAQAINSTPRSDGIYSDTVANELASVRRGGA